ncbi:zinc finger MYM-type 1-like [Brachionus plicatilis]|uniref:Zinc finger MYM-type 1-like n=1 Tax=Brachionus plicatilis TaxID=10195 RepID=A0A3M7S258_BRAPC|nr:zinc finger MYM-type 1-like [Brachionus plicatilis]
MKIYLTIQSSKSTIFKDQTNSALITNICDNNNHTSIEPSQPKIDFRLDYDKRKFLFNWFALYPWLEYNIEINKAFCYACKTFSSNNTNKAFISEGYANWKNAISSFIKHQNSETSPKRHEIFKKIQQEYMQSNR